MFQKKVFGGPVTWTCECVSKPYVVFLRTCQPLRPWGGGLCLHIIPSAPCASSITKQMSIADKKNLRVLGPA